MMTLKPKKVDLAKMIDEAEWSWIKPHVARNAVIVVHPTLDLLDAGFCVVENQTEKVQEWITKGWFTKPTSNQIDSWEHEPTKRFLILIVQPYVLVQEKAVAIH